MDGDIQELIARLEKGVTEAQSQFTVQGTIIAVGSVVVAAIAALREIWFLVPVCLLFGAGIFWLARVASRRNSPERAAPVLAALRDAPERVTRIVHQVTSDSRGVFVTHWIGVGTADGHLHVKAPDWSALLERLTERCPSAKVVRGPGG